MPRVEKSIEIEKVDSWLSGAHGRGQWGLTAYMSGVSFRGDENILESDSGDGCIML